MTDDVLADKAYAILNERRFVQDGPHMDNDDTVIAWCNVYEASKEGARGVNAPQDDFDLAIGRLDRVLSELLVFTELGPDPANRQTLKHHAEDMIGVGNKILGLLREPDTSKGYDVVDTVIKVVEYEFGVAVNEAPNGQFQAALLGVAEVIRSRLVGLSRKGGGA